MIVEAIMRAFDRRERPAAHDDFWYLFPGTMTEAGVRINADSARTLAAVYLCTKILAETVFSLPLDIFRRLPDGNKEKADDHWLYGLLKRRPNAGQTSAEFREDMQGVVTLRGRAIAEKIMQGSRVTELIPLDPRRLRLIRMPGMRRGYLYNDPDLRKERPLRQDQVFEITADSGQGVVAFARESFGYSLALEKHGRNFMRNRAIPGGVLQHPGVMDDTAYKRLQTEWDDSYGAPNTGKVAILEDGVQWQTVGMSNQDMEFLSSRKWTVNEVARWFNMPLSFLKVLDNAIKANVEQQALEFKQYTMQPWLVRWEQAILRDLVPESEQSTIFAEFNRNALMALDFQARMQGYSIAVQNGWLSRNELRRFENMNSMGPAGDIFTIQLNMMDLEQVVMQEAPAQDASAQEQASLETRALGSAEERRRIQNAHLPMFEDVGQRIVNREARELRKLVKKELRQRETLEESLRDFYKDFPTVVDQNTRAAFEALAVLIFAAARNEVGSEVELETAWVRSYTERIGLAYSNSSLRQLIRIIRDSTDQADEALSETLESRISDWTEKRPGKFSLRTVKTGAAAVAVQAYRQSGIRQKRWVTFGENCPSCERLNGQVVGIEGVFVPAGSAVVPVEELGDGQTPIHVDRDIVHPQLHGGCDCQVSAA